MDKKKLTDEEIVKAWNICNSTRCCTSECPYFNKHGRNFCMEDKSLYKDVKRILQEHAEQKAEIKRLTKDWEQQINKARQRQFNGLKKEELARAYEKLIESLEDELEHRKNDYMELQKQVDELKQQFLSTCENCHLKKDLELLRYQKEQAVKDTVKEIYKDFDNAFSLYYPHGQIPYNVFNETLKWLAKSKGVEVEE